MYIIYNLLNNYVIQPIYNLLNNYVIQPGGCDVIFN